LRVAPAPAARHRWRAFVQAHGRKLVLAAALLSPLALLAVPDREQPPRALGVQFTPDAAPFALPARRLPLPLAPTSSTPAASSTRTAEPVRSAPQSAVSRAAADARARALRAKRRRAARRRAAARAQAAARARFQQGMQLEQRTLLEPRVQ
jgi:hypothetical protein